METIQKRFNVGCVAVYRINEQLIGSWALRKMRPI
jgi:hypothetical protein